MNERTDENYDASIIEGLVVPAQKGDPAAIDAISRSTNRAVSFVAKRFYGKSQLGFSDLIQEAQLAVLKSLGTFERDDSRAQFVTYAIQSAENALKNTTQKNKGPYTTPIDINSDIIEYREAERLISDKMGRPATFDEIHEFLGWKWEKMEGILRVMTPVVYLSSLVGNDGKTVSDFLSDRLANPNQAEEVVNIIFDLRSIMGFLSEREERVLFLKYGLEETIPKTQEEISELLALEEGKKVSAARIGQIENGAIEKLRIVERCMRLAPQIELEREQIQRMIYQDRLRVAINLVAERFGVSSEQIIGDERRVPYPTYRQSLMSLFSSKLDLRTVGSILGGRAHGTVIPGIKALEARILTDPITSLIFSTIKRDCQLLLT